MYLYLLREVIMHALHIIWFFSWDVLYVNVTLVVHRQPPIHQNHTRASHVRAVCACNIVRLCIIYIIILCAMRTSNSFAANRVPGAFIKMCNTLCNGIWWRVWVRSLCTHTHTPTHVYIIRVTHQPNFLWRGQTPMETYERTCQRILKKYYIKILY